MLGFLQGIIDVLLDDHVLHREGAVLDELLHEAHEAFNHEAPVVAHGVPPPQEIRDVDELVNSY